MVYFKVIGFIKVVPLGRVICSNFIILCNRSFCNSLSEVLEFRPCKFCASFIHAVSSGDGLSRKQSIYCAF